MSNPLCTRTRAAHAQPLRGRLRMRALLLSVALASTVALMPHAHAQNNNAGAAGNNGAQGKGQPGAAGNANGAPPRKTAAQRTQEDSQRLLGGPSALQDGYATYDASPDAQRDALLNSERMRVAKPNTQQAGGPAAAGGNGGGQPAGGAVRRPARGAAAAGGAGANVGAAAVGGAAAGGAAGGAVGGKRAAVNAADVAGAPTGVYNSPYSNRAGREIFKSPW
jgi:hypothetical protein